MAAQIFDPNNDPVPSETPIGSFTQQTVDDQLTVINPATNEQLLLVAASTGALSNAVAYVGDPIPPQAVLLGAEDSFSNTQPLQLDSLNNLKVSVASSLPEGTNNLGTVSVLASSSSGLTINGTTTANIGTTNGLALDTTVSGLQVSQGSTTSGQKGVLVQGAVSTSDPSYINSQTSPLSLTTAGRLRVDTSASPTDPSIPPNADNISDYVKALKVYTATVSVNMAAAATDNPLVLLRNPTGSGKTMYVYKTAFGVSVNNVFAIFKVFSNPTVSTNGTVITQASNNVGGGAPAATMLANSLPTVSASGSALNNYVVAQNNNSITSVDDFSVHVQPNNSLLITGSPQSNNRQAEITVVWVEV